MPVRSVDASVLEIIATQKNLLASLPETQLFPTPLPDAARGNSNLFRREMPPFCKRTFASHFVLAVGPLLAVG